MGYNLYARCSACGESAFILRGEEARSIRLFMHRHAARNCAVEWAVDNTYSTPYWAEGDTDLFLPSDLVPEPPNPEASAEPSGTPSRGPSGGSRG